MLWRQDKEAVMERITIESGYEREASGVLGVTAYWLALLIKHIVWANPQSILSAKHQESFLQWADRSFSMWVLSVRVQSLIQRRWNEVSPLLEVHHRHAQIFNLLNMSSNCHIVLGAGFYKCEQQTSLFYFIQGMRNAKYRFREKKNALCTN